MADREARRAGAASGIVPKHQQGTNRPTDSQARQRVLRDGKPLSNDPLETQPPRRSTSPVQAIPKRREPVGQSAPSTGSHRSPVLKGSGRGPAGGSR